MEKGVFESAFTSTIIFCRFLPEKRTSSPNIA